MPESSVTDVNLASILNVQDFLKRSPRSWLSPAYKQPRIVTFFLVLAITDIMYLLFL